MSIQRELQFPAKLNDENFPSRIEEHRHSSVQPSPQHHHRRELSASRVDAPSSDSSTTSPSARTAQPAPQLSVVTPGSSDPPDLMPYNPSPTSQSSPNSAIQSIILHIFDSSADRLNSLNELDPMDTQIPW